MPADDDQTGGALPPDAAPVRATPVFTAQTVPGALLRDHATRGDTWGVIEVSAGSLRLIRAEGGEAALAPGQSAVVAPGERHRVVLSPDAAFRVVFHRRPGVA